MCFEVVVLDDHCGLLMLSTFFFADGEAVEKVCNWIRHGVVLQSSINGEMEHGNTKKNEEETKQKVKETVTMEKREVEAVHA